MKKYFRSLIFNIGGISILLIPLYFSNASWFVQAFLWFTNILVILTSIILLFELIDENEINPEDKKWKKMFENFSDTKYIMFCSLFDPIKLALFVINDFKALFVLFLFNMLFQYSVITRVRQRKENMK